MPTAQPSQSPTPQPTEIALSSPAIESCPAIGLCTTSGGDAYSVCRGVQDECPPGSVPDGNATEGSSCHPDDPLQLSCKCCERDCGATWPESPCLQLSSGSGDFTCVPQGTCSSVFYGVTQGASCGAGSQCECCMTDGATAPDSGPPPPPPQFSQCGGQPNVIDTGMETCDGLDLGNETCESLGFMGGTLACHPYCYTYDTSDCTPFGACCTGMSQCESPTTESECDTAGGTFIVNAPVCTPNLCELGYGASPSTVLQDRRQPTLHGGIELGVRTTSTRQAVSTVQGDGGSCTGGCYIGTLGALLYDYPNDTYYLLSNAHVWASPVGFDKALDNCARAVPPRTDGSDKVYQSTTCNLDTEHEIGTLSAYSQLTPASTQLVDAAIARVDGAPVAVRAVQFGLGAQTSERPVDPELGMVVIKSSRTTGFTIGQISGIGLTVNVLYSADDEGGSSYLVRFTNQILVDGLSPSTTFTLGGDSGAVVFEYGTMRAVGVNFAGGGGVGVVTPMQEVLDHFGGLEMAEPPESKRRRNELHAKKRKRAAYALHPRDKFTPRSARMLGQMEAYDVDRARSAMNTLVAHGTTAPLLEQMMVNGSLAAYFIGAKPSTRVEPCLFVMRTGSASELQTLRDNLPQAIDGIDVAVVHSEPIVAANKR